jgi:hypothetical protein
MRRASLAELLLSFVTSPERAAAITGDLLEQCEGAGALRFYFLVGRTALAQLWRQVWAAPSQMAGATFRALLMELYYLVAAVCASFVALLVAVSVARVSFHTQLPDWLFRWLPYGIYNLAVPIALGRWIHRRNPGREASTMLSLAVTHTAISFCAGLCIWGLAQFGGQVHVDVTIGAPIIYWDGALSNALLSGGFYLTVYPALLLGGTVYQHRQRSVA